jgi:GMP synthase-like glutamine amidotransferase
MPIQPVAIFRHTLTEGPGYLADHLDRRGIPWTLIAVDHGEEIPLSPLLFSGLVFMGGPMSVNDALPWIPPVLALIRQAREQGVPILGHCLGSQLMCKAWGGTVTPNTAKEIGWGTVTVENSALARNWWGNKRTFEAFHWHGETWNLPAGATLLARSAHCPHQAFALGPHLGLQCHVEMTSEMIDEWCRNGADEILGNPGPGVQPVATLLAATPRHLAALQAVAEQLYDRWLTRVTGR